MKDYFVLSSKNLRRKGIRSWLTLLGILIGIAAVISLISLGNTLKDTVNAQFDVGSEDIINVQAGGINWVGPPGSAVSKHLTEDDAKAIERIGSVEWAISRHIRTVRAEFNDNIVFSTLVSLPNNRRINDIYEESGLKIEQGRLLNEGEKGRILIGQNIADGKKNGFEKDIGIGNNILLNNQEFRVIGILENKGSFTIDYAIFIGEEDLKEILDIGDDVDLIVVKVKEIDLINQAKEEIEKLMRQRRDVKIGEEDFEVSTPDAILATVNQILLGIQIFIVIIASISIFVGAIGIANTMFTSVLERKKEIGIMKAIGAKNRDIFYQFLIEAGILGLVGGLAGIALGIGISYLGTFGLNSFLGIETKPNISMMLILLSLVGSFTIGAISGIFPAMRAANQNPVEAIRG